MRSGFATAVPVTAEPWPREVRERANALRAQGWPNVTIEPLDADVINIVCTGQAGVKTRHVETLYRGEDFQWTR